MERRSATEAAPPGVLPSSRTTVGRYRFKRQIPGCRVGEGEHCPAIGMASAAAAAGGWAAASSTVDRGAGVRQWWVAG